jgi:GT2 family glycosyltransferase
MEAGDSQPEREPLVSAIVVSYNVKDLLLDCLAALFEGTDVPLEVIVVDNNSRDGSAAAVEAEFPQVKVHRMRKNVGFGKANNVGLEMATGRFVLILNPDVMVRPGCVGELADFLLVRPDVGAVGPRLVRPDGRPDPAARRAFPSPAIAFYRLSGLSRVFPHSSRFGRYNMGHLPANRPHEVDAGTAACLLVRRAAIAKVGLFDPAYFMYGEDLDLCFRLKQGGWKIFYLPSAQALHIKGASSRQETARMLYEFHSAMWTFHHKHYADELPAFGNGLVWAAIWARWAMLSGWSAVTRNPNVSP